MEWETEPYSADSAPSSLALHTPLQKTPASLPLLPSALPGCPAVITLPHLPFHKREQANEHSVGLKSQHCFSSTQRPHSNPCCSVRGTSKFIQLLLGKRDISNPPADLLCSSLPQVIVLNSGMTSWTVRHYFFIALCFLCILSTAQNAGGTCCVDTLCVFSVLFLSCSLK